MQDYRAQLDSDRAARLSKGTNHRSQAPKVKDSGVKKHKEAKRKGKDKGKDKRKSKSGKSGKDKRRRSSSSESEPSGSKQKQEGPVRLSDFFNN